MASSSVSVVIAAHDEATVIGEALDALLRDARPGELDITVAANGCTDDTAAVARSRAGVRVIELEAAGKVAALNAADREAAPATARLYLDADIRLGAPDVRLLAAALEDGFLAVTGRRAVDVVGRPWPVRGYYAVSSRLGWFDGHLYGRGVVMLSAEGRGRFTAFPDVISDDLFLDGLFAPDEKTQVDDVRTVVGAPFSTAALVRRLVRVRAGNTALRRTGSGMTVGVRGRAEVVRACARVVARSPRLAPAALAYVAISGYAAWRARAAARHPVSWGQDRSTRVRAGAPG